MESVDEQIAGLATAREALRQMLRARRVDGKPNKLPVLRQPDPAQSLVVWRRSRS